MDLASYYISIDPSSLPAAERPRYVRQVRDHLTWIHRTTSGRILLNCIKRPNFPVVIRPYSGGNCNAVGGSEWNPAQPTNLRGMVQYSPTTFSSGGVCATTHAANKSGRIFDEILFHELVHVFRTATGKWNQSLGLGYAMRHYDDNEEFIAGLCTNIYISDRSNRIKSGLRDGHQGFKAMSAVDAARFGLFMSSGTAFGLVEAFCKDHPIFTGALAKELSNNQYNPIADYYKYPAICKAFSALGAANDRNRFTKDMQGIGIPPAFTNAALNLLGRLG